MKFSNFDMKMFDAARVIAETSEFKNFHMACIITYQRKIVSVGVNSNKTSPIQKKYNRKYRKFTKSSKPIKDSVHAEIAALSTISYPIDKNIDWKKVKVYIYRISPGKSTGHGMARPCPGCMAALKDKGVRHIYYTTDEGYAYERLEN